MRTLSDVLSTTAILDGATATELNRRGCDTSLPLWSSAALIQAPDLLREVHESYVAAGAKSTPFNRYGRRSWPSPTDTKNVVLLKGSNKARTLIIDRLSNEARLLGSSRSLGLSIPLIWTGLTSGSTDLLAI
jgi:hypothetical protein